MLREIKQHSATSGILTHHFYIDEWNRYQGLYLEWYENGLPLLECTYVNDFLEGEYKKWHRNGTLFVHCYRKNNILHGEYREWNEYGNLTHIYFFADDVDISKEVLAYSNNPVMIKLKFGIKLLT